MEVRCWVLSGRKTYDVGFDCYSYFAGTPLTERHDREWEGVILNTRLEGVTGPCLAGSVVGRGGGVDANQSTPTTNPSRQKENKFSSHLPTTFEKKNPIFTKNPL